jgi:hypothetical protein
MKQKTFNKKELNYILKGLYSMQQSYGGGYPHLVGKERFAKFKDVRSIIKKIQNKKRSK